MDFERRKNQMIDVLIADLYYYCDEFDVPVTFDIHENTTLKQIGFNSLDAVDFISERMHRYKVKPPRHRLGTCRTIGDYASLFAEYLI